MKCRYKYCKHGGEVNKEDAVVDGNAYFHPDCYRAKMAMKEILSIYRDRIDPNPMWSVV